jgi:hypothetical protein
MIAGRENHEDEHVAPAAATRSQAVYTTPSSLCRDRSQLRNVSNRRSQPCNLDPKTQATGKLPERLGGREPLLPRPRASVEVTPVPRHSGDRGRPCYRPHTRPVVQTATP